MTIKCSKCNKDIERTSNTKNAVCRECKKIRDKKNYLKNKPEGDRRGNPELYNISWKEVRRRLTKIEKDGLIKLIKKYERNKI